jgi:hypothetical protein
MHLRNGHQHVAPTSTLKERVLISRSHLVKVEVSQHPNGLALAARQISISRSRAFYLAPLLPNGVRERISFLSLYLFMPAGARRRFAVYRGGPRTRRCSLSGVTRKTFARAEFFSL